MNDHDLISKFKMTGRTDVPPERLQRIRQTVLAEQMYVQEEANDRHRAELSGRFNVGPRPMFATALALIVLTVMIGTAAVANAAKPGDPLFGWDQAAERVRLALTLGEQDKSTYKAQVAEERIHEQLELELEHSVYAYDAARLADQALNQALVSVAEARTKLEDKDVAGAEALAKVEIRLRQLDQAEATRLKIKIDTDQGMTKVRVAYGRNRWEWVSTMVTDEALLAEMSVKTGLPIADLRAGFVSQASDEVTDFMSPDDDGDSLNEAEDDSNTNVPVNRNTNQPASRPAGGNDDVSPDDNNRNVSQDSEDDTGDDGSDDAIEDDQSESEDEDRARETIQVRVSINHGTTEIQTVMNDREQEWKLNSTSTLAILNSITYRTGLPSAYIQAIWDFEQR